MRAPGIVEGGRIWEAMRRGIEALTQDVIEDEVTSYELYATGLEPRRVNHDNFTIMCDVL